MRRKLDDKLDDIYYRVYSFQVSVGNAGMAVFSSFLLIAFNMFIYVMSAIFILYALTGIKLLKGSPIIIGLSIWSFLLLTAYLLFIHRSRYKTVIKNKKKDKLFSEKKNNVVVILNMVIALLVSGLSFGLMILRNRGLLF